MNRRILALVLTTVCFSSILAAPIGASAAQSGLTGDPWVDQYIEQIPTASGGRPAGGTTNGRATGLSRSQIIALANAGGDRFAAAAALAVAPLPSSGGRSSSRDRGARGTTGSSGLADTPAAGTATVLFDAIKGSDDGLGPILPGVLILSLVGAVAFAALRGRRGRNTGT